VVARQLDPDQEGNELKGTGCGIRAEAQGGDDGKTSKKVDNLVTVEPHAAGLDIGSREIWACVPVNSASEPVRRLELLRQICTN